MANDKPDVVGIFSVYNATDDVVNLVIDWTITKPTTPIVLKIRYLMTNMNTFGERELKHIVRSMRDLSYYIYHNTGVYNVNSNVTLQNIANGVKTLENVASARLLMLECNKENIEVVEVNDKDDD